MDGKILSLLLPRCETSPSIKLKENDVPVLDHIVLALLPVASRSLHPSLTPVLLEVGILHHLSHDKALLKICVNPASSLRGFRSFLNGPSFHLVSACSEEVLQL